MPRAENRTIPYPYDKIVAPPGPLEQHIMSLPYSNDFVINHDDLPVSIRSSAIDGYLTWLNRLTMADSKGRERGAVLHMRNPDCAISLPDNPNIGTEKDVTFLFTQYPQKFLPFMRAHSHPDFSCFSPRDLARFMCDSNTVAEGVGAIDANYLLLRTNQTKFIEPEKALKEVEDAAYMINKIGMERYHLELDTYEKALPDLDREATFAAILQYEKSVLRRDASSHVSTFILTRIVAEKFKLGFYVSLRTGEFQIFDDAMFEVIQEVGASMVPAHQIIRK